MPRWVAIIGTTLLLALQYFISGLNEDIAPRLTSYFGLDSSKVSFFLLISTVGLVAILPITYRFRDYFRRVSLLLGVIGLQFFISVLCIFTSNEVLLLITSFLMGGLKIICIIDFLSLSIDLFPFLKNRGLFYGVFYGFVRTMREVSSYFTLTLIDQYDWRVIFIVSAIAAIFSIFICLVLFHRSRMQRKVPLYQVEWISMLLMIVAGVSLCYILTMGKEKEWFASQEIVYASILLIISTVVFVYRQYNIKHPFWNLRVFKIYKQIPLGFTLMLVMYIFYTTSLLYNTYIDFNFKGEEHYLAHIGLIHVVCYAISFPLAGIMFHKGYSKRLILSIGFLCYAFSLIYFCHIIQTDLSYWDLVLPLMLESIAYGFILTTAAAFMATNIPRKHNKDRVMGSITARYVLGTFIGYSFYSNWLFRGVVRNSAHLAENLTVSNLPFTSELKKLTSGFAYKGADMQLAHQRALAVLQEKVHIQATLITIRDISFTVGILAIIVAIIVLFVKRFEMHKIISKNKYRIIPW